MFRKAFTNTEPGEKFITLLLAFKVIDKVQFDSFWRDGWPYYLQKRHPYDRT